MRGSGRACALGTVPPRYGRAREAAAAGAAWGSVSDAGGHGRASSRRFPGILPLAAAFPEGSVALHGPLLCG